MTEDEFRAPQFVQRVQAWADETTESLGFRAQGPLEQFHVRPWSTVFRVPTDRGTLFLKCCGPTQAFEPQLTALLHRIRPGIAPTVLAVHPEQPWMLVADGGQRIDKKYPGPEILDAWRAVLPRYAELQRAMTPHTADALAVGTPDRRADELIAGLVTSIADEPSLDRARDDRLTGDERAALERAVPRVERACADLAAFGIADTVQHDDLHQGNVLIRDGRAVVFDWGDACVSQPFLSLAVTLRFAASRAGLPEDAPAILALRDAYLEPWTAEAAAEDLRAAAALGRRLGELSRTLSWRVVASTYPGVVDHYPGGFAGSLRRVLRHFA